MAYHVLPCEIHRVRETAYERHKQQLQLQHLQLTLPPCHHVLNDAVEHHDDLQEDTLVEDILVVEDIQQVDILLAEDNPAVDTLAVEGTLVEEGTLEEDTLAAEGNHRAVEDTVLDVRDDHQQDDSYLPLYC